MDHGRNFRNQGPPQGQADAPGHPGHPAGGGRPRAENQAVAGLGGADGRRLHHLHAVCPQAGIVVFLTAEAQRAQRFFWVPLSVSASLR